MLPDSEYFNLRLLYDMEGHTVDKRLWVGGRVNFVNKHIPPFCELVTRQLKDWYPKRVQQYFDAPEVQEVVTITALRKARIELIEPEVKDPDIIYRLEAHDKEF